jgi:predicted PhzF superfamily epimerase YddE/YHI9
MNWTMQADGDPACFIHDSAKPVIKLPFAQVDAFADAPFTGNPAAVIPLEAWLGDSVLQAIAAENNLAETAFTVPAQGNGNFDYELRWFTPTTEVDLCGHATLATGHILLKPDHSDIRFSTRKSGVLTVSRTENGYALDLPAWEMSTSDRTDIGVLLNGPEPSETLWRDDGYCVLRYDHETAIHALQPDFSSLGALGKLLVVATAPGRETDVVSRVFAPGVGVNEDPVTGSAHALLTPYWAARLGRNEFTAYQASARGGHLHCRLNGDRAILSGQCRTVIQGHFLL